MTAKALPDIVPGAGEKLRILFALSGARVFVLPNPSGLNASYPGFAEKLVWFERLARELGRLSDRGERGRPGGARTRRSR